MRALPSIRIPDETAAFIRTLHPILKHRVHVALDDIRSNPDTGKHLQADLEKYQSMRVGRFRIIYRAVSRKEIEIIAVGPRRPVYEETVGLVAKRTGL